jgi:hypothetical protein
VDDDVTRPTYVESVAVLKERIAIDGNALPVVERVPRYDDAVLGPSIFRSGVEGVALDGLTLPGLYIARSELNSVSFRGADLHLSAFNWNDVIACDFAGSDLSGADLRGCEFVECNFTGAVLSRADLRCSTFERCTFVDAVFEGTLLGRDQEGLPISALQRGQAQWCKDSPEPEGG